MSSSKKRYSGLFLAAFILLSTLTFLSAVNMQHVKAESSQTMNLTSNSFKYVNLSDVTSNPAGFEGLLIRTRGFARFYASIYMYEDFWLQNLTTGKIPVVTRFSGLPVPRNGSLIEVSGIVEYSNLEGGFYYLNASSWTEERNVILIGWDGVQREHLFELLNRGLLPNLASFLHDGTIVNVTVTDHRTDTKSGWSQILTGYRWWRTGVYNNVYWFRSIPAGYTIPERVEGHFGKENVATAHISGKMGHMEVVNGTGTTATALYTREAIFSNIPSQVDVCDVGNRNASVVGPLALQFIGNFSGSHFFAFFHFSDPDSAGHNQKSGGENSALYEDANIRCDYWLGQILSQLKTLDIAQNTLVYVTADHGFDEGGKTHNNAPYVFLATNDKAVRRNGDQVDVAPTVYYGLGMWEGSFNPALDGFPLQVDLPEAEKQERQEVLADTKPPPSAIIQYRDAHEIYFSASDNHLAAMLLLIDNVLESDGPWIWSRNGLFYAYGSCDLSHAGINEGSHVVKVLAFDEHGSVNSPSVSTMTIFYTAPAPGSTPTSSPSPTSSPQISPSPHPSPSPPSSPPPSPSPSPAPSPTPATALALPPEAAIAIAALIIIVIIATGALALRKKSKISSSFPFFLQNTNCQQVVSHFPFLL